MEWREAHGSYRCPLPPRKPPLLPWNVTHIPRKIPPASLPAAQLSITLSIQACAMQAKGAKAENWGQLRVF
jgi:hypothetical protein